MTRSGTHLFDSAARSGAAASARRGYYWYWRFT
jgi:hypothetical protein